jgi:hypothetical protein
MRFATKEVEPPDIGSVEPLERVKSRIRFLGVYAALCNDQLFDSVVAARNPTPAFGTPRQSHTPYGSICRYPCEARPPWLLFPRPRARSCMSSRSPAAHAAIRAPEARKPTNNRPHSWRRLRRIAAPRAEPPPGCRVSHNGVAGCGLRLWGSSRATPRADRPSKDQTDLPARAVSAPASGDVAPPGSAASRSSHRCGSR